jgi:hypothetical protein
MRVIEGKKDPKLQKLIIEKEQEITALLEDYNRLEDTIRSLIHDWSILVEAERTIHDEEWFISDEMKRSKWEYQLLPRNLRLSDNE